MIEVHPLALKDVIDNTPSLLSIVDGRLIARFVDIQPILEGRVLGEDKIPTIDVGLLNEREVPSITDSWSDKINPIVEIGNKIITPRDETVQGISLDG